MEDQAGWGGESHKEVSTHWMTYFLNILKSIWTLSFEKVIEQKKEKSIKDISVILTVQWVTIEKPLSTLKSIWDL